MKTFDLNLQSSFAGARLNQRVTDFE